MSTQSSSWKNIQCSLLAGGLTGAFEVFVTYPTDYVKTLLQLQNRTATKAYRGSLHCAYETVRKHGPLGLYRGMSPVLAGAIPKQGIRWGVYEGSCVFITGGEREITASERAICGMVAGIVEALAVVPGETVKVRLIEDQRSAAPRYRGMIHGVSLILKEEGVRGIYRGTTPMVVRQAINQATRFPAQFYTLQFLVGEDKARRKSALWNGVAGVIAGCLSVCVNQPADVVRTRMQGTNFSSSYSCCHALYKEGGLVIFYRGSLPRMARVGPNVGLTFTLFPIVRNALQNFLRE